MEQFLKQPEENKMKQFYRHVFTIRDGYSCKKLDMQTGSTEKINEMVLLNFSGGYQIFSTQENAGEAKRLLKDAVDRYYISHIKKDIEDMQNNINMVSAHLNDMLASNFEGVKEMPAFEPTTTNWMTKETWKEKLQHSRRNREGLGMYTLDSFDDETAELLAKYSKQITLGTMESFVCLLSDERIISKNDMKYILMDVMEKSTITNSKRKAKLRTRGKRKC